MSDFLLSLPGYHLRRAANAVVAELTEALAPLDLRLTDASMLFTVADCPRITPSELGKVLGIQRANMVPMVARLEQRGVIFRTPLDGRSFGLELTPPGAELCRQARDILLACEVRLLERVPIAHRDHLVPALGALWDCPEGT